MKAPAWTEDELKLVRQWKKEKVPGVEQAKRLGRSYNGWRSASNYHQLHGCKFWTAKEVEFVRQWQEQGIDGEEQARRLGRSYFSWKSGVQRYKLCGERYTNYNPDIRALLMQLLPNGFTQADVVRRLKLKTHSTIGRITRDLIKRGLLVKVGRKKRHWIYQATKMWKAA